MKPYHKVAKTIAGELYMPAHIWHNKYSEHQVVLLGMIHAADKGFYSRIQEIVDGDNKVHYEAVKSDIYDKELKAFTETYRMLAKATGLVFQKDGLHYKRAWKNYDLWFEELSKSTQDFFLTKFTKMEDIEFPKAAGKLIHWWLRHMAWTSKFLGKRFEYDNHRRNEYAIEQALKETDDVALIWGSAHLPEMCDMLADEGYKLVSTLWIKAISK